MGRGGQRSRVTNRMTTIRGLVAASAAFTLAGCTSLLAPVLTPDVTTEAVALEDGAYALDPAHASLLFKIDHLGYSTYVGRFEALDATLDFEEGQPETARITATVDMTSLDIANDEFAAELMGPDWFDAARFPQAVFRSTSITQQSETTGTMTGELTLHGETRPVTFDVTFNGAAYDRLRRADVMGFSARGQIDRTAFGVDRFSGIVTDIVDIEIEAEFLKTDS